MDQINVPDLHDDDDEVEPEWVEELRQLHRQHMNYLQGQIDELRLEVIECVNGMKEVKEELKSVSVLEIECVTRLRELNADYAALNAKQAALNAVQAAWIAEVDTYNAASASCSAKMEAAIEKREALWKVVDDVEEQIKGAKTRRTVVDKCWKDRIETELEKSGKRSRGRPRKASSSKIPTKRLNDEGDRQCRMQMRKRR